MTRWTDDNTEGFNAAELDALNAAQAALEAAHPGAEEATIADLLNNAFFHGISADQLVAAVSGRL